MALRTVGFSKRKLRRDRPIDVTPHRHTVRMDTHTINQHLDDVETNLRRAKRACVSGSELERDIKRALSALDDAQRLLR